MKVIALTSEQQMQLAALAAAMRSTAQSAGIAAKAYRDAVSSLAGAPVGLQRAELTDDGKSLVVG